MKRFTLLLLILNITFVFGQNAPIDFEPDGFGASWTWATFEAPEGEENPVFSVVANPVADDINGSATVAKMDIAYATDAGWGSAGCESMHGSDIGTFAVTEQNKIVKMSIYQEGFAAPVALKFAVDHGGALFETVVSNSIADQWVEVEFNMSEWIGHALGSPDQIIFFPSYGPRATGHTVYFDNVTFNETGSGTGGGDGPTVAAPEPTRDAADVISIFSDTYSNVPVESLNPNWGQATLVTQELIEGNNTLVYTGLNYQGLQLDGSQDVSGMTHLHIDYWTANSTALNAFIISPGPVETPSSLVVPTSGWASVDIPLTSFSPVDLADVFQFKFDGNGDIYLDNIYFYKGEGGTGGGAPTVGAPVPTRDAADVISVFSDTYTNVPVENYNPDWGQATITTEEMIGGNNTLVYKGLNYQGLQLEGSQDISGMTHLHLDYWTANSTALNVFLISDGPVETPSALAVPTSGWASVDIPLTAFSPVDLAGLIQFKFDGNGDIYLDNIYFYKGEGGTGGGDEPTVAAPTPIHASSDVISIFSDDYTNVPVEDYNPNWGQATITTQIDIEGNNTLSYKGLNYQGLQLEGSQDVSGMTHLHIDYWTANSTALNAFIISPGPVETAYALNVPTSGWASIDIPLTAFSPVDLADIFQFKFDGNGDIYLDNIYFHRDVVSTNDILLESVGGYVYPNPTQNNWTIKTKNAEMSLIQVFDMAGKKVLSLHPENISEVKINGNDLSKGLYFARITTPKGILSTKLIKE